MCDASLARSVDRTALARYLQYQYVPSPGTILAGVEKLAPAHVLVWEDGRGETNRYWAPSYDPKSERTLEEDRDACLELLRTSVRLRLRSDVPVGLFLSGGLDSGTVLALMAEQSSEPVRTFTIGFEDAAYDERAAARSVADHFGARHTEDVVRLDVLGVLPRLVEHFDEPFGDSSAVPTFRVAELAARELRVVLTGDGGDEAFGGYRRYGSQVALERLRLLPGPIRRGVIRGRDRARGRSSATANPADTSLVELADLPADVRYVRLMSMADLRLRSRLLGGDGIADQDDYLLDIMRSGPTQGVDRMLATDNRSYLPDDLLAKMDRATMAHSVEARAPLLDHKVVEFAARLPAARKMHGSATKVLLREVARGLLPPGALDRPKSGFAIPLADAFRGPLGTTYRDAVLGNDSAVRDHLDPTVAAAMLAEHQAGTTDHARRLWLLLVFELWARRWLRGSVEVAA